MPKDVVDYIKKNQQKQNKIFDFSRVAQQTYNPLSMMFSSMNDSNVWLETMVRVRCELRVLVADFFSLL